MDGYDLKILQPEHGYRYSIDAILLAEFARLKARSRVLELGAGCGVISLIIARRVPDCRIHALEIQEGLFGFLTRNIRANGMEDRIIPIYDDISNTSKIFSPGSFHHVVTNPPFRHPVSGRLCLDSQEALARHEILIDLEGILKAAFFALVPKGRLSIVYPAERLSFLLTTMTANRIEPKRLRCIHPSPEKQARMVLVEGMKGGGTELKIEPPVFLNRGYGK